MPKKASSDESIDPVRSRLAAAVSTAPARKPPVQVRPSVSQSEKQQPPADRLTVHRKVMMSPTEAERNDELSVLVSSAFGSKVTPSQITRALWSILSGAEDAVKAGAKRAVRVPVPSKGDHEGMALYEEAVAEFLETALKRS